MAYRLQLSPRPSSDEGRQIRSQNKINICASIKTIGHLMLGVERTPAALILPRVGMTTDGVWAYYRLQQRIIRKYNAAQITITHASLLSFLQPSLVVAYTPRPYGSRTALPNH
jgi:hypothetical protein